jgi:hypothetical protein
MITTICLVFAFVFFVLGTFVAPGAAVPWYGRFNVISAGLACWVFAEILGRSGVLGR